MSEARRRQGAATRRPRRRRALGSGAARRNICSASNGPLPLVVLIVLLLPACARERAPEPEPDRPAITEIGLESRVWRVGTLGGTLPRLLFPHALEAGEVPPEDRDRWRRGGFRLVQLPAGAVEEIEVALPHTGPVRRHWLGQPVRWSRLASRALDEPAYFETPAGVRRFGQGRIDLLTRSWVEPDVRGGPVFRIELAVAWRPARDGAEPVEDMLLSATLPAGQALAIIPAPPGEDWVLLAHQDPAADGDEEIAGPEEPGDGANGLAPLPPPDGRPDTPAGEPGPAPPDPQTIGEALLLIPGVVGERPVPARREVFVLIPRWPAG